MKKLFLMLAISLSISASLSLKAGQPPTEIDNNWDLQSPVQEELVTTGTGPVIVPPDPLWQEGAFWQTGGGWGASGYAADWHRGWRAGRGWHRGSRAAVHGHDVRHGQVRQRAHRRRAHPARHRAHRRAHRGHAGHHGHGGRRGRR